MADEFAWDRNKHDAGAHDVIKKRVACPCGGTAFVELKKIDIVRIGLEGRLDVSDMGVLCIKCNTAFNPMMFLKQVMNERERPDVQPAPEAKEDKGNVVVQNPRPDTVS